MKQDVRSNNIDCTTACSQHYCFSPGAAKQLRSYAPRASRPVCPCVHGWHGRGLVAPVWVNYIRYSSIYILANKNAYSGSCDTLFTCLCVAKQSKKERLRMNA